MAGKWTGAFSPFPDGSGALPGFEWNPRTSKAYAEGRDGVVANNHRAGSDADLAYKAGRDNAGDPDYQFETAIVLGNPTFKIGMTLAESSEQLVQGVLGTRSVSTNITDADPFAPYLAQTGDEVGSYSAYVNNPSGAAVRTVKFALYTCSPESGGDRPVNAIVAGSEVQNDIAPNFGPALLSVDIPAPVLLVPGTWYVVTLLTGTVDAFNNYYDGTLGGKQDLDNNLVTGDFNVVWNRDFAQSNRIPILSAHGQRL